MKTYDIRFIKTTVVESTGSIPYNVNSLEEAYDLFLKEFPPKFLYEDILESIEWVNDVDTVGLEDDTYTETIKMDEVIEYEQDVNGGRTGEGKVVDVQDLIKQREELLAIANSIFE